MWRRCTLAVLYTCCATSRVLSSKLFHMWNSLSPPAGLLAPCFLFTRSLLSQLLGSLTFLVLFNRIVSLFYKFTETLISASNSFFQTLINSFQSFIFLVNSFNHLWIFCVTISAFFAFTWQTQNLILVFSSFFQTLTNSF